MADTSSANYERSVTDPWIKPDDTALQRRRDSQSSHEVRNINKIQIGGIDRERIANGLVADVIKSTSTEKRENVANGNTGNEINSNILDENDLDEYDPDLIITEEERKAFEYMLAQKREEMEKRDEMFENWVDRFTRRRMFALSRMRKLNKGRIERLQFYNHVDSYVKSVETVLNSESSLSVLPEGEGDVKDSNSSGGNQAETKAEARETTDNKIRETTNNIVRQNMDNVPRETTNNIPREDTGILSNSKDNNNTNAQNSLSSNKDSADKETTDQENNNNNNNDNKETPVIVPVNS